MSVPRIDKLDRNAVINGGFDFWQRGTSFTVNPGGSNRIYDADRWSGTNFFASGQLTISRQTDVPAALPELLYSRRMAVTSTIAVSSANHFTCTVHTFEGQIIKPLIGKTVTLSFWVKSTLTGNFSIMFSAGNYDSATSRYFTTYSVSAANTWERKVIQVNLDSSLAFTKDNSMGLAVMWPLGVGTGVVATTANSWVPSTIAYALSSANRTDMLTSGNSLQLAGVSLIEGSNSDPSFAIAGRNFANELQLCQRYYQTQTIQQYYGIRYLGTSPFLAIPLPVTMRAAPTTTNSFNQIFASTGTVNAVVNSNNTAAVLSFQVNTSNTSVDFGINFQYFADAEL